MKKNAEKFAGEQELLMMCKRDDLSSLQWCLDKYRNKGLSMFGSLW